MEKGGKLRLKNKTIKKFLSILMLMIILFSFGTNSFVSAVSISNAYIQQIGSATHHLKYNGRYVYKDEVNSLLTENIAIYYVNLDKLKKAYYNKNEEIINKYKYVIMLILEHAELEEFMKGDEIIKMYSNEVALINGEPAFGPIFTEEEERVLSLQYALEEGIEQGLKQGKKQGLKQGIEQGVKNTKEETAKNMLKEKLDINLISKCTGLTVKKILQMQTML